MDLYLKRTIIEKCEQTFIWKRTFIRDCNWKFVRENVITTGNLTTCHEAEKVIMLSLSLTQSTELQSW